MPEPGIKESPVLAVTHMARKQRRHWSAPDSQNIAGTYHLWVLVLVHGHTGMEGLLFTSEKDRAVLQTSWRQASHRPNVSKSTVVLSLTRKQATSCIHSYDQQVQFFFLCGLAARSWGPAGASALTLSDVARYLLPWKPRACGKPLPTQRL